MKRALYDIWEEEPTGLAKWGGLRWRAQLHNYAGWFASREAAEEYVVSVKKEREKVIR